MEYVYLQNFGKLASAGPTIELIKNGIDLLRTKKSYPLFVIFVNFYFGSYRSAIWLRIIPVEDPQSAIVWLCGAVCAVTAIPHRKNGFSRLWIR